MKSLNGWGLTIVDSLDTMMLMGLDDQVDRAMQFIKDLDFHKHHVSIPLYHLVIESFSDGPMILGPMDQLFRNDHSLPRRAAGSVLSRIGLKE